MNKENFFTRLSDMQPFETIVAEPLARKYYFNYSGPGDTVIGKLSGNPKTTGLNADSIVHEADGSYSLRISGAPRDINKNSLFITLRDNKGNTSKFPLIFHVLPLKFNPPTLPNADKLFTPYKAKIFFQNPSSVTPKFGFNFPVEFGFVKTNFENTTDSTTIEFNPSRFGKFKFMVEALSPDDILLGYRTMNLEVVDKSEKLNAKKLEKVEVKAVDIKDWK